MSFICPECDKVCFSNKSLAQHRKWHKPGYKENQSGKNHYNYGKHLSEETKKKIGKSKIVKYGKQGEGHQSLKIYAKYKAIHMWANRYKPKTGICNICNLPEFYDNNHGRLELSDITGLCLRDINNFQWAHKSCHIQYDKDNNIIHEAFINENLRFV